jgi:hypothetical protein
VTNVRHTGPRRTPTNEEIDDRDAQLVASYRSGQRFFGRDDTKTTTKKEKKGNKKKTRRPRWQLLCAASRLSFRG